jgi:DNA-binding NtrC family response regulator
VPPEKLRRREGEQMKRTILYIDDEVECLNIFQEMFGDEYDVRTAATLGDARRMLAERPADIVISDQFMPEIKGTEFLAEVAKDYPRSCRVMLSGQLVVGEAIPELSSGVIHLFIAKPFSLAGMHEALERASFAARWSDPRWRSALAAWRSEPR